MQSLRQLTVAIALLAPMRAQAQEDRPSTARLVAAGAATAVPTYWIETVIHEGMHALTAKAFGAEILQFAVIPGRYGPQRHFYFGYVSYRGQLTLGQQTLFLLAPKLDDLVWLGGYAALVGFGGVPENHYAQVVLAVVATGFWIDFTKDLVQFWHPADVDVALSRNGARRFVQRLPWRLLHIGIAAAVAIPLVQGWKSAFAHPTGSAAFVVPIAGAHF
ncbi:MAG TPA: hypothetical protein VL172_18545 [Kofleriaceae bacterium]|nr:hypothetical protein [Kofleriaceae bacterium]